MDSRYKSALERMHYEIAMARFEWEAMRGIEESIHSYHGTNFFVISYHALYDDSIARVIRVLDRDRKSATFWYLKRCKERKIEEYSKQYDIDLDDIEKVSDKLKTLRDTFYSHIDRMAVKEFQRPFRDADLDEKVFENAMESVWTILCFLFRDAGKDPSVDTFSRQQVVRIVENANGLGIFRE